MNNEATYTYPPSFRLQILALMLRRSWIIKFRQVVQAAYFPTQWEQQVAAAILAVWDTYHVTPTQADLNQQVPDSEDVLADLFRIADSESLTYTEDMVISWAQNNAMRIALVESIDLVDVGKYDQIREHIINAMQVGVDQEDIGLDLMLDVRTWMRQFNLMNVVATPWSHINDMIEGGLGCGELGVIVAPPNYYKTTTLINIGWWGACMVNRRNVLHFSLEMGEHKVLRRYAARMTHQIFTSETDEDEYIQLMGQMAHQRMRGSIRVKRYMANRATPNDLRDFTHRIEDEGIEIGMIIVDYPDLLRPIQARKERRFELGDIYAEMRNLAIEFDVPVWGASQGNRDTIGRNVVTMASVSEDISKMNTCDIAIGVGQTREQEANQELTLFLAKVREGTSRRAIKASIKKYPTILSVGYDDLGQGEDE